jgi:hypothetical protein
MRLFLIPLLFALVLAQSVRAQSTGPVAARDPFDDVHVYLLTVGPGEAVYEKFGHNMIRVAGPNAALRLASAPLDSTADISFNWGMFSFEQENFIWRFIQGRMLYSAGAMLTADQVDEYAHAQREIWQQELNLTARQKEQLWEKLLWTIQPAHKDYRYDYYRDNCSTRVRDALDEAAAGALRPQLAGTPTHTTFRWHTRRLTRVNFPLYTALHYVLGHPVDQPIDAWEEGFLPVRLMHNVAGLKVKDASGNDAPFVLNTTQLNASATYPEPAAPPNWLWLYALLGLALAGAFLAVARGRRNPKPVSAVLALLIFAWCLLGGLGGTISTWGWLFTDHTVSRYNENWLQLSPFMLPLAVLVPFVFLRTNWLLRLATALAVVQAAFNVVGLVLKAFPSMIQPNAEIIALALPANLALAYALYRLARHIPVPAAEDKAAGGVGAARPRVGT